MKKNPIHKAVKYMGSQSALARAIGVTPQSVQVWVARNEVPMKRCKKVQEVTKGFVTKEELRPDIFA